MKWQYLLATVCVLLSTSAASGRTWTSRQGKTVEAEFVKVENGRVWLNDAQGRTMKISFGALTEEDQALIRTLHKDMQAKAAAEAAAKAAEAEKRKAEKHAALLNRWKPGQVSTHTTTNGAQATYHVYIPPSFALDSPPPLVYAFSPGGNGRGQLNAMKSSAEKAGWIVVGCDNLKNDMGEDGHEKAHKIEDAIIACVRASVPHDPQRVYLSGMSGGAARSYHIAQRRTDLPFAGILAFGGWLGGREAQKDTYPKGLAAAMVNGDNDENANHWVESDTKVLKKRNWEVEYFTFPGAHVMAPPPTIDKAIAWISEQPLPK